QATERLRLGTGVTCPMIRTHPAIVAHAAATAACLMPGRFFLGVGTGENLNEHITGDRWPPPAERVEMLEEAIEVIRLLWKGAAHRARVVAQRGAEGRSEPGARDPRAFRPGGGQRARGGRRRPDRLRSRPRAAPGGDPRLRGGRLHARLPPPGGRRPGRVLPL